MAGPALPLTLPLPLPLGGVEALDLTGGDEAAVPWGPTAMVLLLPLGVVVEAGLLPLAAAAATATEDLFAAGAVADDAAAGAVDGRLPVAADAAVAEVAGADLPLATAPKAEAMDDEGRIPAGRPESPGMVLATESASPPKTWAWALAGALLRRLADAPPALRSLSLDVSTSRSGPWLCPAPVPEAEEGGLGMRAGGRLGAAAAVGEGGCPPSPPAVPAVGTACVGDGGAGVVGLKLPDKLSTGPKG